MNSLYKPSITNLLNPSFILQSSIFNLQSSIFIDSIKINQKMPPIVVRIGGGDDPNYTSKTTLYVVFACIIGGIGGLMFGYDIGISGGVTSMAPFLSEFFPSVYRKKALDTSASQYCKFNDLTLTTFTSSLYLAALVASLCASWITSKLGRRMSMVLGGFVFLAGAALNGAAQAVWMLILGRILLGIGVGFSIQVCLILSYESLMSLFSSYPY
ncbi:sugar carrier protein C-like [Ricinus communis]|uniref:sugar carrier protein C-like n=1 Tax=Ricinus communis TaxID=3988 RepID=UPI00201AEB70|nr:sugar carrier protein C-like [Ricinus communis]